MAGKNDLDRRLLDGNATEPNPFAMLRAGPLTLRFDGSGVRYVKHGDREIVRRVYFAVRDANWGTVPDQPSNLQTEIRPDSFRIEFDVENRHGEIDFTWHGLIFGDASGKVVFEAHGVAKSTFRKNRIGFCVLHPLDCAGMPVTIHQEDGSSEQSQFPRYIADKNPFLNVTAMRYEAGAGADVKLTFEGDVFETEDQRNWIDASFKTFCTPLAKPFPGEVRAGDEFFQRITVELQGMPIASRVLDATDEGVSLTISRESSGSLPRLGFVRPPSLDRLSSEQVARLKLLQPAHLRCELRMDGPFEAAIRNATSLSKQLQAPLEVALFADSTQTRELTSVMALIRDLEPEICRWIVFPLAGWSTTQGLADFSVGFLRSSGVSVPIGGGTPANFRELNATRPPVKALDFITWSMTPQIHAFDNASLVETLAAHAATVESARQFADRRPLVVGPLALKMQVNPYATGNWPPPTPHGQLPPHVDVRQLSLFGAAWTLGSVKYLAENGVHAATYYELVGWKGLMECEDGSSLPDAFPSLPCGVFPLYHIFADLTEMPASCVLSVRSSAPLRVEGLALRDAQRTRVMIANFSSKPELVTLQETSSAAQLRLLDESNVLAAMTSPATFRATSKGIRFEGPTKLELPRYAVATLDFAEH